MRLRIYLGGPISGHDINERKQAFARRAAELMAYSEETYAAAWEVFNPFHNYERLKKELGKEPDYDTIMQADLDTLRTCDGAFFMEGWETSIGCRMEVTLCNTLSIPMCMNGDGEQIDQFTVRCMDRKFVKEGV